MKKIYFILTAIFAVLLSSCTNDDIPVSNSITFKINPSTVVSGFDEYDPGELTVFPSNLKLRVRLMIYNEKGQLISSDSNTFSDYSHIMSSNQKLEEGSYTIFTMTDIISDTDNDYAWSISDEENLTTLTIKKSEYIREQWGILGITTKHINIDSSTKDINIDVKPAGALALVFYNNWNTYTDVLKYKLNSDRVADNLMLNSDGTVLYSLKSTADLDYRLSLVTWDSKYSGAYRYIFLFPVQNSTMQFRCECDDDKTYNLGDSAKIDIEQGHEYLFSIDIEEDEAEWYDITPTNGKGIVAKTSLKVNNFSTPRYCANNIEFRDITSITTRKK